MFKREMKITPAYDKRVTESGVNNGVHGSELHMYLVGEKGAIQFTLHTGWYLDHVHEELIDEAHKSNKRLHVEMLAKPMPIEIGYRSYEKLNEHSMYSSECEALGGCECYYEGSSIEAYKVYSLLVEHGSEAVWDKLEMYYESLFGNE